jgi:hypothetical protein
VDASISVSVVPGTTFHDCKSRKACDATAFASPLIWLLSSALAECGTHVAERTCTKNAGSFDIAPCRTIGKRSEFKQAEVGPFELSNNCLGHSAIRRAS